MSTRRVSYIQQFCRRVFLTVQHRAPNLMDVMENLIIETVEYEFRGPAHSSVLLFTLRLTQIFTCLLVLGTNVPMIIFIIKQKSKTFLDWLIVFDCFLCLVSLPVFFILTLMDNENIGFCIFHVYSSFFLSLCNRLLSLGIVIYRFILVFGSSLVFTAHNRKLIEIIISLAILLISLNLTGWAIYYRDNYKHLLGKTSTTCIGM